MTPADRYADRAPDLEPVLTGEEAESLRIVLVPSADDLARIEGRRPARVVPRKTDTYPEWQREWGGLC